MCATGSGPTWAFTVRYHGELYTQRDYKTLGVNPATATSATALFLFLGEQLSELRRAVLHLLVHVSAAGDPGRAHDVVALT